MAEIMSSDDSKKILHQIEEDLYRPIKKHDEGSVAWLVFLLTVVAVGFYAWTHQLKVGLGVTGLRDYVSWGMYIANFVFFVAVSLIGMLISSVLQLLGYKWVTPITRIAEQIAIAAVALAGVVIIMDMGRPDRVLNVIKNARFASPILWDVTVITTYLTISALLIYLPLIPDTAMMSKRLTGIPLWQRKMYQIISLNWNGNEQQIQILKKAIRILLITIIPVALSIHTVTSWLFAATLRPGWDSTIFGPYFVSGAFVAGCAAVLVVMYIYRYRYHLHNYLEDKHFDLMCKLLVLTSLIYLYFNINEFLVPAYKMRKLEGAHLYDLFVGKFAVMFYLVQVGGLILPIILLLFKKMRKPLPAFIIALVVLIAAWFKRYLIVIPTMLHPTLPIQFVPENFSTYMPTGTEILITSFSIGMAILIITILAKVFPVIPVWEYAHEKGVKNEDMFQ